MNNTHRNTHSTPIHHFASRMMALLMMLCATVIQAQNYQPLNAGFEQWDGSALTDEPTHWNSFATSDGSYASLASTPHHYHRQGGRPGTTGSSYLTIYTRSIIGIKANGNMTTGRIHAGAMSATSSSNYNYTQRSQPDFSQPFTATPDSVYVWVSYYASSANSQASITATIHGDNDFRDPNDLNSAALYAGKAQLQFNRTTSNGTAAWTLLKAPFLYDGTADPAYLLISMTTNKTPGEGAANDSLSIDDFYFVYSAWLTNLSVNGTALPDFDKGTFAYSAHVTNLDLAWIGYSTEVQDATVEIDSVDLADTLRRYTLTVTAEDGTTQRTYTLDLTADSETPPIGISPAAQDLQLKVAPNPATAEVTVQLPETATRWSLQLFDLQGRLIQRCEANGSITLNLAPLSDGTYLLRATSPTGQTLTTPIVKQ